MKFDTCCICWLFVLSQVLSQEPVANIPQGRVVGIKVYAKNSLLPIEIFFGIPYAAPPIGRLRFLAPQRHPSWRRTFFAHRMPPNCPQLADGKRNHINEDCLFLNIWTPRRGDEKLPVLVILHSDSWLEGSANFPCQEIAAEGVVVVTVSFRLHMLSFLTLRSRKLRGNLALLDQYLALLWVRENIAAFGGDPTSVTVLGHSAGADSLLHHIASPRTIGLFQRAVILSPLNIWKALDESFATNSSEAEIVSREIIQTLGCDQKYDNEMLNCLQSRPLSDFLALYSNNNWSIAMQPVIDNFLPESEQYLPYMLPRALSKTDSRQNLDLNILLGTTDLEAVTLFGSLPDEISTQNGASLMEYTDSIIIPRLLQMFSLHEAIPMLIDAVHWEYLSPGLGASSRSSEDALESLARLETAATWGAGAALLASRLTRLVSTLYVFRYSQPNGLDINGRQFNFTGAAHGTDFVALLGDAFILQVARRPATAVEQKISSRFRKTIVNFVKKGSPGIIENWYQYKPGEANVYDLREQDYREHGSRTYAKDISFWLQYLPRLNNKLALSEHSEQLTTDKGEIRLRGGVYGLCGLSVVLLVLLAVCGFLLRKERVRINSFAE